MEETILNTQELTLVAVPTEQESQMARDTNRRLAPHLRELHDLKLQIMDTDGPPETIAIPGSTLRLFSAILGQIAEGNSVTVLPIQTELTTQQAADLLNVSRPFLVKQLEEGQIPYHRTGTHRRIYRADLLAYRKSIDTARKATLAELAAEAQELNMGY